MTDLRSATVIVRNRSKNRWSRIARKKSHSSLIARRLERSNNNESISDSTQESVQFWRFYFLECLRYRNSYLNVASEVWFTYDVVFLSIFRRCNIYYEIFALLLTCFSISDWREQRNVRINWDRNPIKRAHFIPSSASRKNFAR